MTTAHYFAVLFCLLLSLSASAHNFIDGQPVALVSIIDKGELVYQHDKFSYRNWSSAQFPGKVRVIQHIAGRSSAKEQNAALIEAIKAAKLPHDRYQTTTIVDTDDTIPGTGFFVRSSIENNKKQFSWSQFIVDSTGVSRQTWQLESGGSTIVVLDNDGQVRFAKEGALTQDEVNNVITLLQKLLK